MTEKTEIGADALWRAYQLGQASLDHTARQVFCEVVQPLVEQRDRLWKELFTLVEAVQKPGFESVLETARLLPGCRAVLASSGERGK